MGSRIGPGSSGVHDGTTREQCRDGQLGHPIERCRVRVRYGNYSAFNGYRFTPSDYSAIVCTACGTPWRSKASYVSLLKDTSE